MSGLSAWQTTGCLAFLLLATIPACQQQSSRTEALGTVPEGAFALVGKAPLSTDLLREAPTKDLAQGLVRDALLSTEARSRHPDQAEVIKRGILARALHEELADAVLRDRPISSKEFSRHEEALWMEIDRPPSIRSVRAYLQVPPLQDDEPAFLAMSQIAKAVKDSPNLDAFAAAASGVPIPEGLGLDLRMMPPVAKDGRVVPQSPYDETFKRFSPTYGQALHELNHVGQISGVIGLKHGFCVIVATDLIPGHKLPKELRAPRVRAAVAEARASQELDVVMKSARERSKVSVESKSVHLTQRAWTQP